MRSGGRAILQRLFQFLLQRLQFALDVFERAFLDRDGKIPQTGHHGLHVVIARGIAQP
jgi:hypothetical protein